MSHCRCDAVGKITYEAKIASFVVTNIRNELGLVAPGEAM